MRKRKTAVLAVVLVAALGIAVVLYFNQAQSVQTAAAVSHEFTMFIEGAGNVSAPVQVVSAPAGGVVKDIFVAEGQYVRAGDALLQMDDDALRLQLEEAVLALNAQKKEYQRQNGELTQSEKTAAMLAAQTAGYDLEGFNAAASGAGEYTVGAEQVDMARLKVRQAAEMLGNATVYAAIDGIVLEVTARKGELVAAGSQAALVASMGEVEIHSVFSDADASTLAPGMEVQLFGGALGQATCPAKVIETMPKAETKQTQTGLASAAVVKIRPDDPALFTRLGASVELKVVTGKRKGIGVPIEALAQDDSGLYVYVIRGGRAYRANVTVGVLDEYYAQALTGVAEGDVVALNPTELRNRMKVSRS
jgi:membrane fusion protein (multidrug efflux system)